MNDKRTLVNLYKDIELVIRLRIFCTTLFTKNNIKVVIQIDAFLMDCFKNMRLRLDYILCLYKTRVSEPSIFRRLPAPKAQNIVNKGPNF